MSAAIAQTEVKERPIIFSGPMVRAILEGRKTQTRRVIRPQFGMLWGQGVPNEHGFKVMQPAQAKNWRDAYACHVDIQDETGAWLWLFCPYGKAGDHLWVRETWRTEELDAEHDAVDGIRFRADAGFVPIADTQQASEDWVVANDNRVEMVWRPSIFLPRWASRITLQINSVGVERLQDISCQDVIAEGSPIPLREHSNPELGIQCVSAKEWFSEGWDTINAKRGYSWESNPWVWVIEFKKL